jgi:hypothetical protein
MLAEIIALLTIDNKLWTLFYGKMPLTKKIENPNSVTAWRNWLIPTSFMISGQNSSSESRLYQTPAILRRANQWLAELQRKASSYLLMVNELLRQVKVDKILCSNRRYLNAIYLRQCFGEHLNGEVAVIIHIIGSFLFLCDVCTLRNFFKSSSAPSTLIKDFSCSSNTNAIFESSI